MNASLPQKREFGRAETIAERKARLAYDREHPWMPISEAVIDGNVCELQFSDMAGNYDGGHRRFVLICELRWNSLKWVCVNENYTFWGRVCAFRPTDQVLSKAEMARLVSRSKY